ncbi:hypothetical protein NDU88_003080 [Pleurodeles waltl]|uniref:Secreted protein n=1 Tax=Pleurodeles waltl TaxID=8319 RepID=A0AAV7SDI0_PLEWA|nr:hypothetical protein NDU88_003080 [Pleurodeles waltl]
MPTDLFHSGRTTARKLLGCMAFALPCTGKAPDNCRPRAGQTPVGWNERNPCDHGTAGTAHQDLCKQQDHDQTAQSGVKPQHTLPDVQTYRRQQSVGPSNQHADSSPASK